MKVIRHAFNSTLVLSYRYDPVSDKGNINSVSKIYHKHNHIDCLV